MAAWAVTASSAAGQQDDPHAGISCRLCHLGNAARATTAGARIGADPRDRACASCHREPSAAQAARLGFHGDGRDNCTSCHSFHDPRTVTTAAGPVALDGGLGAQSGDHCVTCHADGKNLRALNEAHTDAARLYHAAAQSLDEAPASQGCLNCHDRNSSSDWRTATQAGELTFDLHATHPLGVLVEPGSGMDAARIRRTIDPAIPLFDGRIECQTCHDITAATKDLILPFPSAKDMCLGCHQLKDEPAAPADALLANMAPLSALDR